MPGSRKNSLENDNPLQYSCFHKVLEVISKTTINSNMEIFCVDIYFQLLCVNTRNTIVGSCKSMLVFWEKHSVFKSGCCLKSSAAFNVVNVLDFCHPNRHVVSTFKIYNSLMTYDVEHLFTCLLVNYVLYLVRCLYKSFVHFFRLFTSILLSFNSSLYILYNSPLSKIFFANIFQSVA